MKILKDGKEVAQVDLAWQKIDTKDSSLEEAFLQLVDEGVPVLQAEEKEGTLVDKQITVPLLPETAVAFSECLAGYGYTVEE